MKYVKENCLYGERFADAADLDAHMIHWLGTVANVRIHSSTHRQPVEHYQSFEKPRMKPYLAPSMPPETAPELVRRKVDKTGLISWNGNRYSVPMQYQRGEVYVRTHAGELLVHDVVGERVAAWPLGAGKGEVFKNNNHYRNPTEQIGELEAQVTVLPGEMNSAALRARVRQANPRIYKDQLRGLCKELTRLGAIETPIMSRLLEREAISVRHSLWMPWKPGGRILSGYWIVLHRRQSTAAYCRPMAR